MTTSEENMKNKYAGFGIRLLALLIDMAVGFLAIALLTLFVVNQSNIPQAVSAGIVALIILVNPLTLYYSILTTHYFGATPGKWLTGIRVVSEEKEDSYISLKRSFFRQTVGYTFSWVFFGLGFFSVIKDEKKQAWHDKASGTVVILIQHFLIVGLAAFFVIITLTMSLFNIALGKFNTGPLGAETKQIMERLEEEREQKKLMEAMEEEQRQMDNEIDYDSIRLEQPDELEYYPEDFPQDTTY